MSIEGKGSYVLLIELPDKQAITVGSLKVVHFPRGDYAYVGSALGGFKSRLNRHLRKDKKPQWHIDYLLLKASIRQIIVCETEDRVECAIAQALGRQFDSIPGFGSSDCKCRSHLFFSTDATHLKSSLIAALKRLDVRLSNLSPLLIKTND